MLSPTWNQTKLFCFGEVVYPTIPLSHRPIAMMVELASPLKKYTDFLLAVIITILTKYVLAP